MSDPVSDPRGAGLPSPAPGDERRHPPGPEPLWNESWYFDFATADGRLGGYVRLGLYPNLGVSWYWACVVGEGRRPVLVVDHEAPLPTSALDLRTDGLWSNTILEEPLEHWTIGLEAFAVALDAPLDAYRGSVGEQTALGFDLEWETAGAPYAYPGVDRYEVPCVVHGEVLVGTERIELDALGQRDHSWGVRDWWRFPWTWTAGWLADGTRFHASRPEIDGVRYEPGYVQPSNGPAEVVGGFTPTTTFDVEGLATGARFELDSLTLDVAPVAFAPILLEAADGRVSRFPRALCRYQATDGRAGVGWTEWNQPQSDVGGA